MRTIFHPKLKDELDHAAAHYATQGSAALALRFLLEFERVVTLAKLEPGLGTPMARGRRQLPLRGFPYQLVYRLRSDVFEVLVLRHDRRHPKHGERR